MDLPTMERIWPGVRVDLKYVELRLPGTFRELCADRRFTNDEIGRIIRNLALGTDFFMTPRIEPEVFYYQKDQENRSRVRQRVEKSRKGKKGNTDARYCNSIKTDVTVTDGGESAIGASGESYMSQKTPLNPEEKTPPIVPLEKNIPSPLEKTETRVRPVAAAPKRKRSKAETQRDQLADDLFSLAGDAGRTTETGDAAPESSTGRQGTAQDASGSSGAPDVRPERADASKGILAASDSRVGTAWIPEKFAAFWKQYPRKVAKSDAVKAFTRLIKAQKDVDRFMATLMASLEMWKANPQWTKDKGMYIPYPATWLNAGHWEDSNDGTMPQAAQPAFLKSDAESDEDLIRRMAGG